MRQRGRKPAGAVVVQGDFGRRLDPPEGLTERQAEIWRAVTQTEPPDFFATAATRGLLADYCARRDSADRISAALNEFSLEELEFGDGMRRFSLLSRMRDLESKGAAMLAGKLRLTNRSRYNAKNAGTAARNQPPLEVPWER